MMMPASLANQPLSASAQPRTSADTVARQDEVRPQLRPFVTRNADGDRSRTLQGPEPATVVVMGIQRSGTTMTVGILQILGVEFGDDVADRGEDVSITRCLLRMNHGLAFWRAPSVRRQFAALIAERRSAWSPFGFKSPFLAPLLWLVAGAIPNPVYICVMRNPLSAVISGERWGGPDWAGAFWRATFFQFLYARFLLRTKRPVLIYGFEDSLEDTEVLLDHLAHFLGITVTDTMREHARSFVSPRVGYRNTRRLQGFIEAMTPLRVAGWVSDRSAPDRSLTVEVWLDGERLAQRRADLQRDDVAEAGHHANGRCGFEIALPSELSNAQMTRLEVKVPELGHTLRFRLDAEARSEYLPPAPAKVAGAALNRR